MQPDKIHFVVNELPVAQPRHKATVLTDGAGNPIKGENGRFVIKNYIDGDNPVHQFKYIVRRMAIAAMQSVNMVEPWADVPLVLELRILVARPAWADTMSGRGKDKQPKWPEGEFPVWKRPDLDNYEKATMDALKGTIWRDDSQVSCFGPRHGKFYHAVGDQSRVEIACAVIDPWAFKKVHPEPTIDPPVVSFNDLLELLRRPSEAYKAKKENHR